MISKVIWILALLVLILCACFLQNRMHSKWDEYGIIQGHYRPSESASILLLGGFRALAIDLLWIRAISRHMEKKYYESMAINNLISRLQPDFPGVWTFQAWNMAYNIAYEWQSPVNKWKWIRAGIEFAKKGADKNPSSADIAFELGYMYLHLFDSKYFEFAGFYRQKLMEEMDEDNYEEAILWFRRSTLFESKIYNALAMERMVCHSLWRASLQAEKEGRLDDALDYANSSINEWNAYIKRHLDDPMDKAKESLQLIEQKREEIIRKMRD